MIKIITFLSTLLVFVFGLAYADPKKVGFIYIGPPGDHGWTYMHDVGRKYMESQLGDSITCLLYTSPSPRDGQISRMPSSA